MNVALRKKRNTLLGTITGFVLKIIQIIFPFALRTIFIKTLGIQYLGLNSLFTSVLQVINLAELGISSALVFTMYKPIATNDKDKICALMKLYKSYYQIIGFVVLFAGIFVIPFLPKLISGEIPSNINLVVVYLMNLVATVLSYWLFAHRYSLFVAHQRNDIINVTSIAVNLIVYAAQIVLLLIFHNYYIYLSVTILYQIIFNVLIAFLSKKFYPDYSPVGSVPVDEKRQINKKIKDLFTAKLGGVVNKSVDSIVISSFLGLSVLAIYQNYFYIVSTLMAMFMIFFSACNSGIGNSLIISTEEENKKLFYNINFITFFALNFCCASLICLYQPFMTLWLGKEYLLDFGLVILFAVYLFAEEAPRTMVIFKDAGGIWKEDKFRPLICAGVNLILNLLLVNFIGLYGILISTIISLLFIDIPWLIHNIDKHLLKIDKKHFVVKILLYSLVICLCSVLSYFICCLIKVDNLYLMLFIRLILCTIISFSLFILFFWKTKERKYMFSIAGSFFGKIFHQKNKKE